MISVTKADGGKQPFEKEKIIRTCLRMHASLEEAEKIADKIEEKIYEGITTKKILQMIFLYLKKYRPEIAHIIDLREAISLLRPKPDFENFVSLLLKEDGYNVKTNQIVPGKCVEHEVDIVASKNDETLYVEVKHHFKHHTYTGLDIFLQANSTLEDLKEGCKLGKHSINFTKALVICNTKISDHARRYANCNGIMHIGWKDPLERGLEAMVEEKGLYPITFMKGLTPIAEEKLGNIGIVSLKQLIKYDLEELHKKTGITKKELKKLIEKAKEILK